MFGEYASWMAIVGIVALLLGIINAVLVAILLLRPSLNEDDIKDTVQDSIYQSNSRIRRAIESLVDGIVENKVKKATIPVKEESAQVREEVIVKNEPVMKPGQEITLPTPVTLYASSYMNGAFRRVATTPDDRTIYTITAASEDAPEGVISIDMRAYEKVANTPDYLSGACIVSGNGSIVNERRHGTVNHANGQWTVVEQIEVELN